MRDVIRMAIVGLGLAMPNVGFADQSVAGNWKADIGQHDGRDVSIIMSVSPDGEWASKTMQGDEMIAAMSGTYEQTAESPMKGKLIFKPDASSTATAEHGALEVENDEYELQNGALSLTSGGDTMVFHKQ